MLVVKQLVRYNTRKIGSYSFMMKSILSENRKIHRVQLNNEIAPYEYEYIVGRYLVCTVITPTPHGYRLCR